MKISGSDVLKIMNESAHPAHVEQACLPAGRRSLSAQMRKGTYRRGPPGCQDRRKKPDEISQESLNMDSIPCSPNVNPVYFIYS